VEQVRPPLSRGDGSPAERPVIVLHVGQEVVQTTDSAFEVEEEVGALGNQPTLRCSTRRGRCYSSIPHLLVRDLVVRLIGWSGQRRYQVMVLNIRSSCALYSTTIRWNLVLSLFRARSSFNPLRPDPSQRHDTTSSGKRDEPTVYDLVTHVSWYTFTKNGTDPTHS
jgi:hypothetical protein